MQDVESELGMSRDKLIQLALLLGSDYTEGVAGIGIVNAVEIVNAFPTEDLLVNFRCMSLPVCLLHWPVLFWSVPVTWCHARNGWPAMCAVAGKIYYLGPAVSKKKLIARN